MNSSRTAISRARPGLCLAALLAGTWVWLGAEAQNAPPPNNGIVTSEGVKYRFAYAGNVAQIPLRDVSGRLLLPVRVNMGKPGFFLVATGDAHTELDPKPWMPDDAIVGAQVDFEHTLLSLPGLDMQLAQVLPASLVDLSDQVGERVHGILGADVLRQFVVELEYDRSAIHFYDANSFQYSGKGFKLPLIMSGGVPRIRVKVALLGRPAFEDDFAIQTESEEGVAISPSFAAAHHVHVKKLKGYSRPEPTGGKTLFTRIKSISIGPYNFEDPIVAFPPAAGPGNATGGTIGNAMLSRFRIFLDQPRQQAILETSEFYKTNFEWDMSGVVLAAKGANLKTFEVVAVAPHTPASEAGLQKGDVIAGVDGQPAADLDLSGVRAMFREFGHEYHLTVQRGDHTVEMKMRTKRLV